MKVIWEVSIELNTLSYTIEADTEEEAYNLAEEMLLNESQYDLAKYSKMIAEKIEREGDNE
jgi:hypothetical protein